MGRRGALPAKTKQAICADSVAGLRNKEIAEKYHVHRVTVSKVLALFRKEVPNSTLANPEGDYRQRLKGKAIKAVENGLDCSVDAYKQGNLRVSVLKGIGEWAPDIQSHADFFINIEHPNGRSERVGLTVPNGWREKYGLEEEGNHNSPAAISEKPALPPAPGDDEDKTE